jgi:hypothetical protein
MSEKVNKLSVLLQSLSRIPGLGFLASADYQMRETAEEIENVGDEYEERSRQVKNVRDAAGQMARDDDD